MPRRNAKRTISEIRRNALKSGYRSGLEVTLAQQIEEAGLTVLYETEKISFVWPQRAATYCPDFKLPSKDGGSFYVEGKGIWSVDDRHKHLLIKDQCPDVEVRFVFSNANARLYKGSPTTYAQWCEEHGFQNAHKTIPDEWLIGENDYDKPKPEDPGPSQEDRIDQLGRSE